MKIDQQALDKFYQSVGDKVFAIGLLVGLYTEKGNDSATVITHLIPTPKEEDHKETQKGSYSSLLDVSSDWFSNHVLQVQPMLNGSHKLIGLFTWKDSEQVNRRRDVIELLLKSLVVGEKDPLYHLHFDSEKYAFYLSCIYICV